MQIRASINADGSGFKGFIRQQKYLRASSTRLLPAEQREEAEVKVTGPPAERSIRNRKARPDVREIDVSASNQATARAKLAAWSSHIRLPIEKAGRPARSESWCHNALRCIRSLACRHGSRTGRGRRDGLSQEAQNWMS